MSWASQIEEDLEWREGELASLKLAVASAKRDSTRRALLRALSAMLYAHYEGFTKFCWDLLLIEIERAKCQRCDVNDKLAILSLSEAFKHLRKGASANEIWDFANTGFAREMRQPTKFSEKLDTKSNLWPNVARENNELVGLTCEQLELNRGLISSLVGRRNEIAHGQKLVIHTLDEYAKYEHAVFLFLTELAVTVSEHLERRLYLRVSNTNLSGGGI